MVAREGVIRVGDHPQAGRTLSRLTAQGRLVRLFPGVYAAAEEAERLEVRCAALMAWDPDAVITGVAAARLLGIAPRMEGPIEFHSRRKKWAPAGFRLHRSGVDEADVVAPGDLRVTRVARTALHLAARDNGAMVDEALRLRRVTLEHLADALGRSLRRSGNRVRRLVLRDSRDEPWSQGERELHRLLRRAGITGWVTNLRVELDTTRFLDVAFLAERLVIEFDGRLHHGAERFEDDRERQNALVHAGWTVVRVTWRMLQHPVEWLAMVRDLLCRGRRSHAWARRV